MNSQKPRKLSPQHVAGLVLIASLPIISGSECVREDAEPPLFGTNPPGGRCDLEGGMTATHPHPTDLVCAENEIDLVTPCKCSDLVANPQPLVIVPKFEHPTGCHTDLGDLGLKFVLPNCAFIAEASGHVAGYWRFKDRPDEPGDEDTRIELCTDPPTMRVDPFLEGATRELRTLGSFSRSPQGAMHLEVQDCRWYDGNFMIPATVFGSDLLPDFVFPSRPATPAQHEMFSAAGDWVADFNHDGTTPEGAHAELHEARAVAIVKPVSNLISVALPNAFFAEGTRQQDHIHLGIKALPIPDSINSEKWKLNCRVLKNEFSVIPQCTTKAHVGFQALPDQALPNSNGRCNLEIDRNEAIGGPAPLQFLCSDTCNEHRYAEDDQDDMDFCSNIHFMNPVVMEWKDPGDIWECQCACDDPSAPGAIIAAPVQGCAELGLDPMKPADRQVACAQVCGGQICGAAPACRIGECHAPASGSAAQLLARKACDPTKPQALARVSAAGDYHVTIDHGASSFDVHFNEELVNSALDGTLHFNLNEVDGVRVVDFANTHSFPDDFSILGLTVADATVLSTSRVFGQLGIDTAFQIPANAGSFFAQSLVAGKLLGEELLNPDPVNGLIDLNTREFVLDLIAEQPSDGGEEEEGDRAIVAHLVGTIDNVPPVAVSGGPTRTVECSAPLTPVTLNGSLSYDPDPGDSISHYQWFTAAGAGMGNQAVVSTAVPLGHSGFVLHVYDADLGSAAAPLDINVVDSIAPTLTLSPQSACVWPPDHKRIRFRLGTDVTATVTDVCDAAPTVRIVNVTSNQPDNTVGDGNVLNDTSFSDHAFCIRRERTTQLGERVYSVTIEARDASGNTTTTVLPIHIATNHNGNACPNIGTVIANDAPCE